LVKHLYTLHDLSKEEIEKLLELTRKIKGKPEDHFHTLEGKTLAMIFESASLRTRSSFEVAMNQLGGGSVYIKAPPRESFPENMRTLARIVSDIYLAGIESIKDTAKVMSRYVDVITCRFFKDEMLETMMEYSDVPVINAMTPGFHPCQGLTDLFTILEKKDKLEGLNLTFYGDLGREAGTNVGNELFLGCAKVGINVTASVPEARRNMPTRGFARQAWKWALEDAKESGAEIKIEHDPLKAAKGADVIYSFYQGTMIGGKGAGAGRSDGQSDEGAYPPAFPEYQVRKSLVDLAKPDVIVMHCLPAHRGLEITSEVLDGPHSIVYDQAENRLHTAKAILVSLITKQ